MDLLVPVVVIVMGLVIGGAKKKKKRKPSIKPGPGRTTPTPGSNTPSDPLPPGTRGGHLPKGEDYESIIPEDMTTADLWVSPDCQAFLIGSDWAPMAEDVDPYEWFVLYDDGRSYREDVADIAEEQSVWPYEVGLFPEYSTLDGFAIAVLAQLSPLCAETMPRWSQYVDEGQLAEADPDERAEILAASLELWQFDWTEWEMDYPQLAKLYEFIKAEASESSTVQGLNVSRYCGGAPEEYVGFRTMVNAWDDNMPEQYCIEFGEGG